MCITNADGISNLTIDSITADDGGKYVVRVDNGLGNDYHFASVAVEGTRLSKSSIFVENLYA